MVASEESEVDIEVEEMQYSSDVDDDREEEEGGEDELEESENDQQSTAGQAGPLKIKLKLGAQSDKPVSSRRYARARNDDIESEDSDSEDSNTYTAAPSSSRQLTARQAVLANTAGPSHVALETPSAGSSKKATQNPTEVALRKEENARKRKNMIEKKLEDEKAETIHRLLKKQSRPKNKRTAGVSDEEVDPDEDYVADAAGVPAQPMYRWVSSSRRPITSPSVPPVKAEDVDAMLVDSGARADEQRTTISFSVPESFLPVAQDEKETVVAHIHLSATVAPSRCAVEGCEKERKYRAVGRPWGVGACGLGHLRVLEGRA
ncbi:PAPA-1-like conserved region-domain-containing protein [Mycena albidolilacea]|uniref:PAPA-1-like conserved region-domain-containing protein n=1 Tax=Mycena albidolilacea TaxID=1033008 RepID=A0AAD7A571_9AGAR|nr:PAPA-1-like conserved region-domain-containing protein [Mycena albidolilacea]